MFLKSDFPCFDMNPGLVYLDNAATTQKPRSVIDGVSSYVEHDYANIHRGAYALAERSEDIYQYSKQLFAQYIGANSNNVVYTYNATYAFNMIAQTLAQNGVLVAGNVILLPISEHHANIVPRQMIAKQYRLELRFIDLDEKYNLDRDDFARKYTADVKVLSVAHISNVTGAIFDLHKIKSLLREDTLFIIDASQGLAHSKYDLKSLEPDFFVGTAHKMFAYTGLGMCVIHDRWIESLTPARGGGGVIERVDQSDFSFQKNGGAAKREPGTPHLIGAVSLAKALEYIASIGGIDRIMSIEQPLIDYACSEFQRLDAVVKVIGSLDAKHRSGVFSFVFKQNSKRRIAQDLFAQKNICLRGGGHCTHPFWKAQHIDGALRISLSVSNDMSDLICFFDALQEIANTLERF